MSSINFRSPWFTALYISMGWQIIMTVLGVFLERHYSTHPLSTITPLNHMTHWDGGWYLGIITHHGYQNNAAAPVFYPLFPLAVIALQAITLHAMSITFTALIVNTVTLWMAIVALIGITKHFTDNKYHWLAVALFLASPAALFMHLFYAEAIFCALAFWAYLFALHRKWLPMALTLAFLGATKLPAILIIGLCGLEFIRAYRWNVKEALNPRVLYFLISPIGFILYGLYLQYLRGDFLAMFHGYHATSDWSYHVFNPDFVRPIYHAFKSSALLVRGLAPNPDLVLVNEFLPLVGLGLLGLTSLYGIFWIRGKMIPLGAAGLASIIFFSINSNIVSVHRYLLPSVILYLTPVILVQKSKPLRYALYGFLAICVALQVTLFYFFVSNRFAG